MKLPNGEQAIVDRRKIVDYCLSRDHDDGQHKAHLFLSILGLTSADSDFLIDALRKAAASSDIQLGKADNYGQRYVIDFELSGPSTKSLVRSAWIIRTGEAVPRLVTCYIL
jgi:hypothetical protein